MRSLSWTFSLCLLVVSVGWSAPAAAQECRIDQDCVLPDGVVIPRLIDLSGRWSWRAGAAGRADGYLTPAAGAHHSTAATATFELAYAGSMCRWLALAGDLSAYRDAGDGGDAGLSGRQALTFCLPQPVFMPEMTFSYERNLRPTLGATPSVAASRVGRLEVGVRLNAFSMREETTEVRFAAMSVATGLRFQDVDDQPMVEQDTTVDMAMLAATGLGQGFLGADQQIALLRLGFQLSTLAPVDGDEVSSSVAIDFLVLDMAGFRVPNTEIHYDLGLGFVVGGITAPDGADVQHIHPSVRLRLMAGTAARSQGLSYRHSLQTSTYGALVAEDRLSAWLRSARSSWSGTMTGYAALTQFLDIAGVTDRVPSGGLGAVLEHIPTPGVRLALEAELARSFYALLDGQAPRDPAWAGRVGLSVGLHAGSGR